MCGIVGVFTTINDGLTHTDTKIVRDLTIANTVRGDDGTGVFYHKKSPKDNTSVWYLKDAVAGPALFDATNPVSMLAGARFAVVHNRAATTGCLTSESAHPFVCENVVGVHNGTVRSIETCIKGTPKDITVDSHAILDALSRADESEDAAADVLVRIERGAYALVWIDHRTQQLRFARNSDRPLHFATTASAVWFASELPMLEWILGRHRVTPHKSWSLKPHHLVSIPIAGGAAEVLDYTDKLPKVHYPTGYGYSAWYRGGSSGFADDSDDDDYTPGYRGSLANVTVPRHIDALGRVTLGNPGIPTEAVSGIYDAARKFIGESQWLVPNKYGDLAAVFADKPRRYAREFYHDKTTGKLVVPVYILAAQEDRLLSYIEGPNSGLVPVVIGGYLATQVGNKISGLLKRGEVVEVSGLEMTGLRFYHNGDVVMRMGQTQYKESPTVRPVGDVGLAPPDDTPHPEEAAYLSIPDWSAGWGTIGGNK